MLKNIKGSLKALVARRLEKDAMNNTEIIVENTEGLLFGSSKDDEANGLLGMAQGIGMKVAIFAIFLTAGIVFSDQIVAFLETLFGGILK